jgi:putative redox protein
MGKEKSARATWAGGMRFDVRTGSGHTLVIDVAEQDGGHNAGPTPTDLLVAGLASCTGMDVVSILAKMRQNVTGLEIAVHGVRQDDHPQVFRQITVEYVVTGHGVREESVRRAIELSETKYCTVSATLAPTATITTSFRVIEAGQPDPADPRDPGDPPSTAAGPETPAAPC